MKYSLAGLLAFCLSLSAAEADTLIVGNKHDNTVSFFDLSSGDEAARRETGRSPHEIAVSPDGRTAVLVSYRTQNYIGNSLHVFDVESASKTAAISLGDHRAPHGLKWIPETSRVIATTEESEDVVIVDIAARAVLGSVKTNQQGSHMVALSPDAKRAYVANIGSGTFTAIDMESMTKIKDVTAGAGAEAIAVSPDGAEVWVGANDARTVSIFDADSLERLDTITTEGVPIRVELSPDGAVAAVSEWDFHRVAVYDAKSRSLLKRIALDGARGPVTMLFSPDGARLWVAAPSSAKVVEVDTANWSITRVFDAGRGSDGLGFSPLEVAPKEEG